MFNLTMSFLVYFLMAGTIVLVQVVVVLLSFPLQHGLLSLGRWGQISLKKNHYLLFRFPFTHVLFDKLEEQYHFRLI